MSAKMLTQKKLEKLERIAKVVYLASYIPRECGIATFTKDLTNAINILNPHYLAEIMAINDPGKTYDYPWEVKFRVAQNSPKSYNKARDYVNQSGADAVSIQHEYGLHGGSFGNYLIDYFMKGLKKPVVTTLHTVRPDPDPAMKEVTKRLCEMSQVVVVMAECAITRLVKIYQVDAKKIVFIPHGVPDFPKTDSTVYKNKLKIPTDITMLSTFGLIESGKGIEYIISALPKIIKKYPKVVYYLIGQTHPVFLRNFGDGYRRGLQKQVHDLKLEKHVKFINRYLSLEELVKYIKATDIYVNASLDPEQITSGTLAYAVGAGKVCVSSPYIYAREILGHGRGLLTKFQDSAGIAKSVNYLLSHPKIKEKMEGASYALGRKMIWSNVALRYLDLFNLVKQKKN